MQERERIVVTGLTMLMLLLWLGFAVPSVVSHRSLVGSAIGEPMQWAGGVTACGLALLLGRSTALLRATAGKGSPDPAFAELSGN